MSVSYHFVGSSLSITNIDHFDNGRAQAYSRPTPRRHPEAGRPENPLCCPPADVS